MGIRPSAAVISPEPSFTFANRPAPMPQPPVPRLPPAPSQQCGVAPNFRPCVSSQQASHVNRLMQHVVSALLECCRRKNLPPGCLALCRYDITQAEVRSAMDRGLCGIFSVAPYLECASQGKDNTECCRHKGVVAKT
ncbi:DB module [Ancylostoma duodenale]|uniref:DB module n=1 Tax=Ancylostoma duodenale TaxID=51022 RepID=A0A0C2G014_9BILA|nr:DB module [Ancylostoma duodenale]